MQDHIGSKLVQSGIAGDSTGHIGPTSLKIQPFKQENQKLFSDGAQH